MKKNLFKKIVFVITVFLLLTVIAFTIFMVINKYSFNDLALMLSREKITDVGVYKTIDVNNENTEVCLLNNYIYVVNPYKVLIYDINGERVNEQINDFENPYISYNDDFMILYDSSKTYYEIYKDGKKTQSVESGNLSAVVASRSDYISIIKTGFEGFSGEVITENSKDGTYAAVKYANLYPVSTTVLGNSDFYVVVSIDAMDLNSSNVDLYNLYKEKPVAGMKIEGEYFKILSLGDELFLLIGEQGYQLYDSNLMMIDSNTASVRHSACHGGNTYLAYTQNGKNYVLCLNSDGKEVFKNQVDFNIEGLFAGKNAMTVYNSSNIVIYSPDGKLIEKLNLFSLTRKVLLTENDIIAVVGIDDIVLYKYQ
ncbi:MAG: hypothetical protein JXQ23_07065 [Clostridia bacterium]|nr:hypothetical protein [Clostridia bacterium]